MKSFTCKYLFLWLFLLISALPAQAVEEDKPKKVFSQAQLDQIMAPVALYPDALLSQVLMASTWPSQVAQAAKWSKDNMQKKDKSKKGDDAVSAVQDKKWDPSVASLVAFPLALEMMSNKPEWTQQMGDAFLADSAKVMTTVQGLRKKAEEAGNLKSTEQQKVTTTDSTIIIESSNPQVVYVPAYNPAVVYGIWWWPAYPPYYYPPPPRYGFGAGFVIGFGVGIAVHNSIWGGVNWGHGSVNINVNRYNKINVNNKISGANNNVNWKHNANNQRSADKRAPKNSRANASTRNDFRGRDAQRQQALTNMKRQGLDPAAGRSSLRGSSGDKIRNDINRPSANRQSTGYQNSASKRTQHASSGNRSSHAFSGLNNNSGFNSRMSSQRGSRSSHSFRSRGGGHGGRRR